MTLTQQDKDLLIKKGISEEKLAEELACFEHGFPYLKLYAAASVDNGILELSPISQDAYLKAWDVYTSTMTDKRVVKFVPASGAASRMFKDLFAFLDADYDQPTKVYEQTFFANIRKFAFYDDLEAACQRLYGKGTEALVAEGRYKSVVSRKVNVHFTVSPQHRALFEAKVVEKAGSYANKYGVEYDITFSEQKPNTDTIAVDLNNQPFREENGELLFRPGGHGALIENLNDLDADIVFIKNIDNVASDRMKGDTVIYKKILAGVLVTLQQQAFSYLQLLESGKYTHDQVINILQFVQKQLFCKNPEIKNLEDSELVIYLKNKLNRPMRVCGMVKNLGEPGGGPFLAYNSDGTISSQILESSQIDMNDPEKKALFEKGTHFNPVDLVCAIKDYQGNKFDLPKYVDKSTGFISQKSKNGRELKALELPGLWNGAMSDWNTVFVEVPVSTFNPVKVVNDLLREAHQ